MASMTEWPSPVTSPVPSSPAANLSGQTLPDTHLGNTGSGINFWKQKESLEKLCQKKNPKGSERVLGSAGICSQTGTGVCMRAPRLYTCLHVRLPVLPNLYVRSCVCLNVLENMYVQLL